jgi:hypothetical protein
MAVEQNVMPRNAFCFQGTNEALDKMVLGEHSSNTNFII